jgi:DNA-binding transcriptional ArsR family regulator
MLSRLLGVSLSTTHYHVFNLERDGEIVCRKEGEYVRAYPSWVRDERSRRTYAILQQKAARRILRALLRENDGSEGRMTNGGISRITSLSQSTVSEYLTMFRDLQMVKKVATKEGNMVFEIADSDRERLSSILSSRESTFLSKATDNYVSLWDF